MSPCISVTNRVMSPWAATSFLHHWVKCSRLLAAHSRVHVGIGHQSLSPPRSLSVFVNYRIANASEIYTHNAALVGKQVPAHSRFSSERFEAERAASSPKAILFVPAWGWWNRLQQSLCLRSFAFCLEEAGARQPCPTRPCWRAIAYDSRTCEL